MEKPNQLLQKLRGLLVQAKAEGKLDDQSYDELNLLIEETEKQIPKSRNDRFIKAIGKVTAAMLRYLAYDQIKKYLD